MIFLSNLTVHFFVRIFPVVNTQTLLATLKAFLQLLMFAPGDAWQCEPTVSSSSARLRARNRACAHAVCSQVVPVFLCFAAVCLAAMIMGEEVQ